jgi:hypothetical protein
MGASGPSAFQTNTAYPSPLSCRPLYMLDFPKVRFRYTLVILERTGTFSVRREI